MMEGSCNPIMIKIKPATDEEDEVKELQLFMANHTLEFIEKELPLTGDNRPHQHLKNVYGQMVRKLNHELRLQQSSKYTKAGAAPAEADSKLIAQLSILKFQRTLLVKLHKEGEFSDDAIRHLEREMDIEELKLNARLPGAKEEVNP